MVTIDYYKNLDPKTPSEEIVAMLIHDLRSPVASLEGAASLLMEDSLTEEDARKLKALILSNTQHMKQFLDDTSIYLEERKKLRDTQNDAEG